MRLRPFIPFIALTAALLMPAQSPPGTPVIRTWGSAQMRGLLELWQAGFAQLHPGVHFENHMQGAVSALGGLYSGVADVVLNREIWPVETMAFEQVRGYPPTAFEVATGSFDVPTKSDALHIFVHKDNPIAGLTLTQLAAIFGPERKVRSWGDLGLYGAWTGRPIHVSGYKLDNAGSRLFADLVMGGSSRWNPEYREFGNLEEPGKRRVDAGFLALQALALDSAGIAIANLHYATAAVKPLPLARTAGDAWIVPSRDTTASRAWPLTRGVFVFVDRAPGAPVKPTLAEFLRYVLSEEGQRQVTREGGYLPLTPAMARAQLERVQ